MNAPERIMINHRGEWHTEIGREGDTEYIRADLMVEKDKRIAELEALMGEREAQACDDMASFSAEYKERIAELERQLDRACNHIAQAEAQIDKEADDGTK